MHHSFILLFVLEWNAANQALATLAFFGVGVNLVLFLTRVLRQDSAEAANNVSKWTGTVYIFSLIGAFLSDSYWGRYLTCAIFQFILVLVHPLDPIISKKKNNISNVLVQNISKSSMISHYLMNYFPHNTLH